MNKHNGIIAGLMLLLFISHANASVTISSYPSWEGASWGYAIGEKSHTTATAYGQTFVAPENAGALKEFSIWISDSPIFDPDPLDFKAYIMKWDGAQTVGDILYSSAVMDTSGQSEHGEWLKYSFNMGLALEKDEQYVFFISVTNLYDGIESSARVGATTNNVYPVDGYPGGHMVYLLEPQSFLDSPTPIWGSSNDSYPDIGTDLVFEADFDDGYTFISIDIKPDSTENAINLNSPGVVPVAILGTETLDVSIINPESIFLSGASVKITGKSGKRHCYQYYLNSDPYSDLICNINVEEILIENILGDDVIGTTATLYAKTYDGKSLKGEDVIKIISN